MTQHSHALRADTASANSRDPTNNSLARAAGGLAYMPSDNLVDMASQALPNTGGGQAHNNMQPFLAMNFIIALNGLYPSRS